MRQVTRSVLCGFNVSYHPVGTIHLLFFIYQELALGDAHHDCIFGRMLLKSQAPLLAPERNVLDAARQSIQLRG